MLSNDDVVARTPRILGVLPRVARDVRRLVESNQGGKRYNNQFALAAIKGRIAMQYSSTTRINMADVILDLSYRIGSFVSCVTLLAELEGDLTIEALATMEQRYCLGRHSVSVAVQADEIRRFIRKHC